MEGEKKSSAHGKKSHHLTPPPRKGKLLHEVVAAVVGTANVLCMLKEEF